MIHVQNYINGTFRNSINKINPATGDLIATIPKSDFNDIDLAVNAAKKAFPLWSNLTINERANWLKKIANELEKRFDEVAKLESKDTGKPITLAKKVDATRSVSNFRFFANL